MDLAWLIGKQEQGSSFFLGICVVFSPEITSADVILSIGDILLRKKKKKLLTSSEVEA